MAGAVAVRECCPFEESPSVVVTGSGFICLRPGVVLRVREGVGLGWYPMFLFPLRQCFLFVPTLGEWVGALNKRGK